MKVLFFMAAVVLAVVASSLHPGPEFFDKYITLLPAAISGVLAALMTCE